MKSPNKIVMLGTRVDACGGIASVIGLYQSNGFFERRNIVYLATHCSAGHMEKIRLFIGALARLLWLLSTRQVALLHIHVAINASFWRKYLFLMVGLLYRAPTVLHIHAGRFPDFYGRQCGALGRLLIRFGFNRSDAIVAVSAELNGWLRGICTHDRVSTIHNPTPTPTPTPTSTSTATATPATGVPGAPPRAAATLLYLGHIVPEKGAFDLIRAMPAIVAAVPDARLLLCGDGNLAAARTCIRELGLEAHIELPGWIDKHQRDRLLRHATLFVLPSHAEGLPMSLLEAMAGALPVVASAVGGIPEAVTNGVEGLLVPAGDVAALGQAVIALLASPERRHAMGVAGQARAETKFSCAKSVAAVEGLYDQLMARQSALTAHRQRLRGKPG